MIDYALWPVLLFDHFALRANSNVPERHRRLGVEQESRVTMQVSVYLVEATFGPAAPVCLDDATLAFQDPAFVPLTPTVQSDAPAVPPVEALPPTIVDLPVDAPVLAAV